MRTSRKLTHVLFAVVTLVMMSMAAFAQTAGNPIPTSSEASDQKPGSILFYNYYSSDSASTATKNTQINITNVSSTGHTIVHFFFVAGGCSVADFKTYLTPSQTETFYTSDFDPDQTGYIMAVAEEISVSASGFGNNSGLPWAFNNLIGDLYTWDSEKAANLGAIAFAALFTGTAPGGVATTSTVSLAFNGQASGYNLPPTALALSNIPSRAAGLRMTLILNNIGGNYLSTAGSSTTLFGLLYDDQEQSQSFSVSTGQCQSVNVLSDTYPRTVPRFTTVISAGRTGWMRLYASGGNAAVLGSTIQWSTLGQVGARGGHNLHALTLATSGTTATTPVFPY